MNPPTQVQPVCVDWYVSFLHVRTWVLASVMVRNTVCNERLSLPTYILPAKNTVISKKTLASFQQELSALRN